MADIERRVKVAPKNDDTFGTGGLYKEGVAKYRELGQAVDDLKLCLKTRALSWYVLSLYPGEHALKVARRNTIETDLKGVAQLQASVSAQSKSDIEGFSSFWNREKTLVGRKDEVLDDARDIHTKLESTWLVHV